jgi:hypothetical protein
MLSAPHVHQRALQPGIRGSAIGQRGERSGEGLHARCRSRHVEVAIGRRERATSQRGHGHPFGGGERTVAPHRLDQSALVAELERAGDERAAGLIVAAVRQRAKPPCRVGATARPCGAE